MGGGTQENNDDLVTLKRQKSEFRKPELAGIVGQNIREEGTMQISGWIKIPRWSNFLFVSLVEF